MEGNPWTLITGASSGLGREIAILFSQSRRLILNGRDADRLNETRKLCAMPERQLVWPMDLGRPADIETALRGFLGLHQASIECFVHCAATLKILPMRQMELALAYEIMNVNFFAAAEIVRLLVKRTVNRQQVRNVVFVSSTASQFGAKGFSLYCASKGALDSLMRALAVELAPETRVNSVLPGGILTPMTASILSDQQLAAQIESGYPLGLGRPSDIAAAVEFLCSEKARWVTGHQLIVDGGRTVNISA